MRHELLGWLRRETVGLAFPPICPVCRMAAAAAAGVCDHCRAQLPYIPGPACRRCGGRLDTPQAECRDCADNPRRWERAASAFVFAGLARDCVHRFKYHGDVALVRFLAGAAWAAWQRGQPDGRAELIVPVPLHWCRALLRGYNQAELIAAELGRHSGWPLIPALCRRRWTPPQSRLSRAGRRENLRRAFAVTRPAAVHGRAVLLVDDVMTTGTTLDECTRRLLAAGAAAVHVLTVARR